MDYVSIISFAALGLVIASLLIPLILRISTASADGYRVRMYHHTHKESVSRLGGIALVVAFLIVAGCVMFWFPTDDEVRNRLRWVILTGSAAMFLLGLWDDLRPLGARKKLVGQILIAAGVCWSGVRVENFQNPLSGELYDLGMWSWVVTIFWLVALTNIINLVDGVDGLAGGICLMLMGLLMFAGFRNGLVFPTLCAAGIFGALLGFLRYNFPPAKIYMGDGGAYFLGFLIGMLTLVYSQKGTVIAALIAPLLALALPILDVSLAIVRRGMRGLPLFRADRGHIHHRLLQSGLSRTRTVLVLYGFSLLFLGCAFVLFWMQGQGLPILLGFIFLTLLLAMRMFDFSRHWLAVGQIWENSLELRRETHYTLALARWLELEAERSGSLEQLWQGFVFMAGKLGLVRAKLTLVDGERSWESASGRTVTDEFRQVHDLSGDGSMVILLEGDSEKMSAKVFDHVSELAVEAWAKSAARWRQTTGQPLCFTPHASKMPAKVVDGADASAGRMGDAVRPV